MKIAYDIKQMRPGCVLVAAGMGADIEPCHAFDVEDWLLAPTPDMKVYEIKPDELKKLVQKTRIRRKLR